MKKLFLFIFLVFSIGFAFSQNNSTDSINTKKTKETAFQMKQYWFIMLTKGPNRNQDSLTSAAIQKGHMENIGKLHSAGKLMVAGPFGDDGNWRGIFILDCKNQKEAEELLQTDPAIKAGRLAYEIHPWWTAKTEVFK
jgi:uncharacterized protein YciI